MSPRAWQILAGTLGALAAYLLAVIYFWTFYLFGG